MVQFSIARHSIVRHAVGIVLVYTVPHSRPFSRLQANNRILNHYTSERREEEIRRGRGEFKEEERRRKRDGKEQKKNRTGGGEEKRGSEGQDEKERRKKRISFKGKRKRR
jgi:hypothetical protein